MWYKNSYRRNLIDMHIPDWNEEFLSKFDPENYVDMLELAQVDTAYIYTTSCLGLCYWPTKIGKMHAGLKWPGYRRRSLWPMQTTRHQRHRLL